MCYLFFFFNDTATTEIYTLSLHDALPIYQVVENVSYATTAVANAGLGDRIEPVLGTFIARGFLAGPWSHTVFTALDRKSTRLNSSHANISYAVFCLKKKKKYTHN